MVLRRRQASESFGDPLDRHGFWMLLQEHLQYLRVLNYSEATVHKRSLYVRAFALWCLDRELGQPQLVTRLILELFQRHLFRHRKKDGQPLAWSGQHLHLKELRAFFSWLAKANHIPFNPSSEIELPKQPRTLPKAILSSAEVERILSQPDPTTPLGLRDRAILETLYSTGIRRSELCALRVNDLQWDRQSLFVNQGKGQKDRYVPIGQRALLWITRYIDHARDRMLLDSNEPTLFVSTHGQRLHPDTVTEYTRRYIKAAGITKPGSCHLFRHTMATLMLENGADIRYIQSILGHSKLDTTQIYTRTSLRKLVEVHRATHPAERLDAPP